MDIWESVNFERWIMRITKDIECLRGYDESWSGSENFASLSGVISPGILYHSNQIDNFNNPMVCFFNSLDPSKPHNILVIPDILINPLDPLNPQYPL